MRKNTFTLVEMLSVVAVIMILCGIIFGVSSSVRSRSADIKTRTMLKEIEIALKECKQKFGYYPVQASYGNMEKNMFVVNNDSALDTVAKKYSDAFKKACNFSSYEIKNVGGADCICDAYGQPLQYRSNGKTFSIYSNGRDGLSYLDSSNELQDIDTSLNKTTNDKNDNGEHDNADNIYLD